MRQVLFGKEQGSLNAGRCEGALYIKGVSQIRQLLPGDP